MRVKALALVAALVAAGCSSSPSGSQNPPAIGQAGSGGAGSGGRGAGSGSGGQATPAPGGSGGSSSGGTSGAAGESGASGTGNSVGTGGNAADAASPDLSSAPADTGSNGGSDQAPASGGGEALLVVGQVPLIGSDIQISEALVAKGLKVEPVLDSKSTTANATGKQLVVLSYSVDSEEVTTKFVDVPAAIIVMEHVLLQPLGMTDSAHGWVKPATQITITAGDSPLTAGLPPGDVTVFSRPGSVFWGVPSAAAIKAASVKGNAGRSVLFAYPKGAMMAGKVAPGKRLNFFLGAHLVPEQFLNETGIKLLGASIAWSIE